MSREGYDKYINGPIWAARRAQYFSRHAKKCRRCGSKQNIHLHHHTYVRLFEELDDDLVPLCVECHRLVHQYHKTAGGSLTEATLKVIASNGDAPPKKKRQRKKSTQTFVDKTDVFKPKKPKKPRRRGSF